MYNKKLARYIIDLVKYDIGTGPLPEFRSEILKDNDFLTLVTKTSIVHPISNSLSNYKEYKNSWLKNEIDNLLSIIVKKDKANEETLKEIITICQKKDINICLLKEYSYKLEKNYVYGERFSSDIDILIAVKDIYKFDNEVKPLYLNDHNIRIGYKPIFDNDYNLDLKQIVPNATRTETIKNSLNNFESDLKYLFSNKTLLELHYVRKSLKRNSGSEEEFVNWNKLQKCKKNLYVFPTEDLIIELIKHLISHLEYKTKHSNGLVEFIGFFIKFLDFYYLTNNKEVVWDELYYKIRKQNLVEESFFYFNILRNTLGISIPSNFFEKLSHNVDVKYLSIIDSIDPYNLLFDVRDKAIDKQVKYSQGKIVNKHNDKNLIVLISIIKNFFHKKIGKISIDDEEGFLDLVKETCMDGIVYLYCKDKDLLSANALKELEVGYKTIKNLDEKQKVELKKILDSEFNLLILKEWTYKLTTSYMPGTRYSCDIDLEVSCEDVYRLDSYFEQQEIMSDGVEMRTQGIYKKLVYQANKNVQLLEIFLNLKDQELKKSVDKKILEKINKIKANFEPEIQLKLLDREINEDNRIQIQNSKNRITKIIRTESLNYHTRDIIYIDMHVSKVLEAKSKEHLIIFDAKHFCNNLKKRGYSFQGFLKYLTDFYYRSETKINWDKLIDLANKVGLEDETRFYLYCFDQIFEERIPRKKINKLNKGLKYKLIYGKIDVKKLIQNQGELTKTKVKLFDLLNTYS